MEKNSINLAETKSKIGRLRGSNMNKVIVAVSPYLPGLEQKNNPRVAVFFEGGSGRVIAGKSIELVSFSEVDILRIFFNGTRPEKEVLSVAADLFNTAFSYMASRISEELVRKGVKNVSRKSVSWEEEQNDLLDKVESLQRDNPLGYSVELDRNSVWILSPHRISKISLRQREKNG